MPTTDAHQHVVPAATGEAPARAAWDRLSASIRDLRYVATTTARAALVAALTSAGKAPSASNPLVVWRADAATSCNLEVTTNGTTWSIIPAEGASAAIVCASGYQVGTGSVTGTVKIVGSRVNLDAGRIQSTGSTAWAANTAYVLTAAVAAAYCPVVEQTIMSAVHYGGGTPVPVEIIVNTAGTIQARPTVAGNLGNTSAYWVAIPPMSWARA